MTIGITASKRKSDILSPYLVPKYWNNPSGRMWDSVQIRKNTINHR